MIITPSINTPTMHLNNNPSHNLDHHLDAHLLRHNNNGVGAPVISNNNVCVHCAACDKPIQDRFLFNVLERPWHCSCVQCADCGCALTDKCYSRDGNLFCKEDFFRRFGTKCGGCGQGISPNDLVRRARGEKVFHLKCFTCMVCRKQLSTGEELYVLDENKFICKDDYLASKYNHASDMEDEEADLEQQLMDKLDQDNLSEKGSSFHDDDSMDSGLPPMSGLKIPNGSVTLGGQGDFPFGKTITSKLDSPLNSTNSDLNNKTHSSDSTTNNSIKIKEEILDKSLSLDKNDNPKLDSLDKEISETSSCKGDGKDSEDDKVEGGKSSQGGAKRRGPRTTIKAKQLETLKAAFAATPKPTRHIREQLAQETGLNMRVIQVWFQNRRSKERRMKQLSALGARRAFFRNPRRMRGLDDPSDLMGPPGFGYFGEGDFYPTPGFPGYPGSEYAFHPGGDMGFMPGQGPPMMDAMQTGHMPHDQFGPMGDASHLLGGPPPPPPPQGGPPPPGSTSSTPDTPLPSLQPLDSFNNMPPRSMATNGYTSHLSDNRGIPPGHEMAGTETWGL